MAGLLVLAGAVAGVVALNRALRRRDEGGYWDRDWWSDVARPGTRKLLDFSSRGGFGAYGERRRPGQSPWPHR